MGVEGTTSMERHHKALAGSQVHNTSLCIVRRSNLIKSLKPINQYFDLFPVDLYQT
jgi:hypothetical protein